MDPLFDFIGVQPGYRENDVNAFFCLFFPIFFGMIVGDAGYAVIFLLLALAGKHLFRNKPQAKMPLNLFIMLSCAAFIWGWLNGSWFGIPLDVLPQWMRGWTLLSDPANSSLARQIAESTNLIKPDMPDSAKMVVYGKLSDKFVQYICFLLAALHLGSARIFKFFDEITRSWLALGHLGWACLIIANFFLAVSLIVFPGTFPATLGYSLYGGGLILILATIRGEACLNLPFALTGSFVDVLSYIRLFAVGLSGAYIAENFNKMALMLLDLFPGYWIIAGFIAMGLVMLAGHLLNIALGFLSVMVHGIRLNTLEFSNHVEMQWAGFKFRPFANPENTETNNIQS
jgi:V/A-type H+-transporting ATPase subunit I